VHQAKSTAHKRFLFFQPTGEFLIETEKGKGSEVKKPRSREFKNSPASNTHSWLRINGLVRICPQSWPYLSLPIAYHPQVDEKGSQGVENLELQETKARIRRRRILTASS